MQSSRISVFKFISFFIIAAAALLSSGCETHETLTQKRIKAVERGLLEAVSIKGLKTSTKTLAEQMQYYRVPGVSITVLDNYSLAWSKGYGNKQTGVVDPVSPDTLFQAGTLSQTLTAAGVLQGAEKGLFDLDGDITDYLIGWSPRAQSGAENSRITPMGLLLHTAGISDQTFSGYPAGEDLPDFSAILRGENPATTPLIWQRWPAGTEPRYAEGGYLILQKIIEDTSHMGFSDFMGANVLQPAGMSHSLFSARLSEDIRYQAAAGHLREGEHLEGKWWNHPELAAAGLWTTAPDLARFALTLISDARGTSRTILTPASARRMLSPQIYNQGIALTVDDEGDNLNFHRQGTAEGYSAFLVAYPSLGQGAAIMTNSANGQYLIEEILRSLAAAYKWPHFQPEEKTLFRLDPSIYMQYVGRYEVNPDYVLNITYEDYYLIIQPTGQAPTRFYVENPTTFFSTSPYIQIRFVKGETGEVSGLILRQAGNDIEAKKIQ